MVTQALREVVPVSASAIRDGLQNAQLKGRFQLLQRKNRILLDVGHNPQAVASLRSYLQEYFGGVKIHAVFAMMRDKDIGEVISLMRGGVDHWYLAPLNNPRAASVEQVLNYFRQHDVGNVASHFANFEHAFFSAEECASGDDLIVIFGSFFLVSEYLSKFAQR